MPPTESIEQPLIPLRLRRPLAAAWISLALHAALLALVQVAPPGAGSRGESVIEARLASPHTAAKPPLAVAAAQPDAQPPTPSLRASNEAVEPTPVATPASALPAESVPPLAASAQPDAAAAAPATPASPSAVTLTSAVDLTYYSVRDLDQQPRALREIVPDYPADADRQRLSGKVRLQLKLEADGRVSDVEVVSAAPPDLFNDSAVRAFRDARFAPAQRNGRPVRALVLITVVYDWEGRR